MSLRLIEVCAPPGHMDTLEAIASRFKALEFRTDSAAPEGMESCSILARSEKQQELVDQIQGALGEPGRWRMTIIPVEATVPEPEEIEGSEYSPIQATREELYAEIENGARLDSTFVLLVLLSTVVATIGLLQNSVAVVIAAMLIAPLLGPNVAMAFGATLGDRELVVDATLTNIAGVALSVVCAAGVGLLAPMQHPSAELLSRTSLGYDSVLLALASGAAGALSLTTRLPSTLVGVMVAVAMLPPAVTLGYMLGTAQFSLAGGAAALLAVNLVCVNLAAQLVFVSKGIKPRTWIERRAAKESVVIGFSVSGGLLALLIGVIWWQHHWPAG